MYDFPPPPFPDDATMFFCIGAQKAGTTWLHSYLSRSAEVHFSPNKELHYFDVMAGHGEYSLRIRFDVVRQLTERLDARKLPLHRKTVRQLRDATNLLNIYTPQGKGPGRHRPYLSYLLAGRKDQPIVGDITPAYAILRSEHFADMASIGRAKFLFILRDPVARMWSQIRMAAAGDLGREADADALSAATRARAESLIETGRMPNIERANYARTFEQLEAVVPEERRLYVFYEDLFSGPATDKICAFLRITPPAPETEKRVNEGIKIPFPDDLRAAIRQALDAQYKACSARFGDALPAKWQL